MNIPRDREDVKERLVHSAITFHPDVQHPRNSFSCRDWSSNRSTCLVRAEGVFHGHPVQESREVEIFWKGELCTRCSRMSGGYYEGVVQVRATRRPCTEREKDSAIRVAEEIESTLREGGDPLSFISRIDEVHQGIDIVVGTQAMGRMIAQGILSQLGGSLSTHPKLVGEKDGVSLYRVTYAVRLPRFQKGDVIEVGGKYQEVRESTSKLITLYDLQTGDVRVTRPLQEWRRVGNVCEAQKALVAYFEKNILGLIDSRNGVTREVPVIPWIEAAPGNTIRVVPDDERNTLVIVG